MTAASAGDNDRRSRYLSGGNAGRVRLQAAPEGADVAAELLASLEDELMDNPRELEQVWAAEIERRARRVLAGESSGAPWEDVKQRIERRLAK